MFISQLFADKPLLSIALKRATFCNPMRMKILTTLPYSLFERTEIGLT